jgi:hypothetical protein
MTATEAPEAIPLLLPLLREMASSSDPNVSRAIQEYLVEGTHHAGLRHMREEETA